MSKVNKFQFLKDLELNPLPVLELDLCIRGGLPVTSDCILLFTATVGVDMEIVTPGCSPGPVSFIRGTTLIGFHCGGIRPY